MRVKVMDVVEMVAEQVPKEEDLEKKQRLALACSCLDELAEEEAEYSDISCEVEIDEESLDITVSLICLDLNIVGTNGPFFRLLKQAKRFLMRWETDESVRFSFTFDGIWEDTSSSKG